MARKLISLLVSRIAIGAVFTNNISKFVLFDSLYLFVTWKLGTQDMPAFINFGEEAGIASQLKNVFVPEASGLYYIEGRYCSRLSDE